MTRRTKPQRSPLTRDLIADTLALMHIAQQTEERGDHCLIWTGGVSQSGHPIIRLDGCPCTTVRRVVVRLSGDRKGRVDLAPRQPVTARCDEKLCVSGRCLEVSSIAAVAQKAAARGAFSGIARGMKIAAARRGQGKLTADQAAEIRLSTESGPVLAARYGIHKSMVNNIKRGDAWKSYGGPFSGLGARP